MKSPFDNYDVFWGRISRRNYLINSVSSQLNTYVKYVNKRSFLPDFEEHLINKDEENCEGGWAED